MDNNKLQNQIDKLNKIVTEQNTIIELLIERLTDLANDFDKSENPNMSGFYLSSYRTEKWNWK